MIKYPWSSSDQRVLGASPDRAKYNVFSTEAELFRTAVSKMGLELSAGAVARHPMSFLAEAADDVCYRMLDLEDAVEIGVLPEAEVRRLYQELAEDRMPSASSTLAELRGSAIYVLIDELWRVFVDDYDAIMTGRREDDLKSGLGRDRKATLSRVATHYRQIFAERSKVAAELGAYKALGRIVKALCTATSQLAAKQRYSEVGFVAQRTLELAWTRDYAEQHEHESYEWWLHQVFDYVAGLTDGYTRQLSREIEGT